MEWSSWVAFKDALDAHFFVVATNFEIPQEPPNQTAFLGHVEMLFQVSSSLQGRLYSGVGGHKQRWKLWWPSEFQAVRW